MDVAPEPEWGPAGEEAGSRSNPFRCFVSYIDARHAAVVVKGELDLATAPVLSTELEAVLAPPVSRVTVDLSYLTFLDSSGLAALITARARAIERGITLALAALSHQARLVLEASGLSETFGVPPDACE